MSYQQVSPLQVKHYVYMWEEGGNQGEVLFNAQELLRLTPWSEAVKRDWWRQLLLADSATQTTMIYRLEIQAVWLGRLLYTDMFEEMMKNSELRADMVERAHMNVVCQLYEVAEGRATLLSLVKPLVERADINLTSIGHKVMLGLLHLQEYVSEAEAS